MLARTLVLGGLAMVLGGCGITGNFRNDPGYADFSSFRRLDADSDFGLSIGPLPLKIAEWALRDDEDVGPLIRELRGVRVYTFDGVLDAQEAADGVAALTAELAGEGWLHVIAVRENDGMTSVFLKPDRNFAHRGLAVVVQEPDEVVLVNLIGNVNLDLIAGYMQELDVEMPPLAMDPATLQAALSSAVEDGRQQQ
jgi:hypothetical protein